MTRVPLKKLHPAPWNPRTLRDERFQNLCRSIEADPGLLELRPVLATKDGTIYGGNMRYRAAQALGWTDVPAVLSDIPEQLAKERALRDNGSWGAWVDDDLSGLLAELKDAGSDIDLLGFDSPELDQLLAGVTQIPEEDEADLEPPADPITKPGDLWLLGEHRLLCGDSTNETDVARLFKGRHPVLMATDPPYGVELDQGWRDRIGINRMGRAQDDYIAGDDRVDWAEAFRLAAADVVLVWHAGIFAGQVHVALETAGYDVLQQIIWAKNMAPLSRSYYHWKHEPAWFGRRKGRSVPWHVGRDQTTVWEAKSPKHIMAGSDEDKLDHPTQKPVVLWAIPVANHTVRGEVIYDPFAGSGPALAAAEGLGRVALLMEQSPAYCDVIVHRWEKLTGKTAVLAELTSIERAS